MNKLKDEKTSLMNQELSKTNIPCLYLESYQPTSQLIVYFHANAEDIGLAYPLLETLRRTA